MKKLIFSLMGLAFCGFMAQGQTVSGHISGTVLDAAQQPVPGIAVFYYVDTDLSSGQSYVKEDYSNFTFTDSNGNYSMYYYANNGDTVGIGVLDCMQNIVAYTTVVYTASPNQSNINIQISCLPDACDVLVKKDTAGATIAAFWEFSALSLRDHNLISAPGPTNHQWVFSDGYTTPSSPNPSPNWDTIWRSMPSVPPGVIACYQRYASCTPICTGPSCSADFFVDTVNSINFQGQVVIWENSTSMFGNIIGYRWDFGDGNISNVQYPVHTYSDSGVYEVCLTIVAVNGGDTCSSTSCDSIGFDSNGNLIYKATQQGFTINVIDPATVGHDEEALKSLIDLYPNPSNGEAVLSWDQSLEMQRIDVLSINGEIIQTIVPDKPSVQLRSLNTGIYVIRIQSEQGVTAKKMIVH